MKISPKVWVFARIFVGVIFAYAGFTKLMDPVENFQGALAQYEAIPYLVTPWIARILPWFEFIPGIFLILGYAPKLNASILACLCLAFLLVLGSSDSFLQEGGKNCGCFGENSPIKLTLHQVFIMDLINFCICLRLFTLVDHPFSLDRVLHRA